MKKLLSLAGAMTACVLLAASAHAARGDLVLRTIGNTDMLSPTSRCPEGVARVRVGVQVGTRTVTVGTDVVRLPIVVQTGTATFCVRRRLDRETAGGRKTTASGILILALAGGRIDAAGSETQSPTARGMARYSSLATIRGGTGQYRGGAGVIVATGSVGPAPDGRQFRKLTFRIALA